MASISTKIREKSAEIGIARIGIVPADALLGEGARLREWLALGFQGEMSWIERAPEKRGDPRVLFPGAKTIIAAAVNYYTPHRHASGPAGKISRYAWGDDYHDVVRERLVQLLDHIKDLVPGAGGKVCVDTSPIMEKAWAARAGLGWIGKHTNLITREFGSWVFLGEIILDIELEYDAGPIGDHCGTCTACLDACPTAAIVEPYVVDSNKCISYATIELRDEKIPAQVAERLDGWIYGCDVCQDVCPWNRFEQPSGESRFEPRNGETSLDLDSVAALNDKDYAERFRLSPIKRAKLAGLKRNARYLKILNEERSK